MFYEDDLELSESEPVQSWTAADEGDRRYDQWVEDQMDRHNWPGNRDTFLMRVSEGEDEMERARRRAFIREAA
jgi:hypothetical protein